MGLFFTWKGLPKRNRFRFKRWGIQLCWLDPRKVMIRLLKLIHIVELSLIMMKIPWFSWQVLGQGFPNVSCLVILIDHWCGNRLVVLHSRLFHNRVITNSTNWERTKVSTFFQDLGTSKGLYLTEPHNGKLYKFNAIMVGIIGEWEDGVSEIVLKILSLLVL